MSDTVAAAPDVTIATKSDGAMVALMHVGEKLRQVFARGPEDLARRVTSAAISEFGMDQDAAHDHAVLAVSAHVAGVTPLAEHIEMLQGQLADTQAEHEATLLQKQDADVEFARARDQIVDLERAIAERDARMLDLEERTRVAETAAMERLGRIESLENLTQELRANAAGETIAAKNPSPDAGSAAAGTEGVAGPAISQRTDTPPEQTEAGAATGADGPVAAAASGDDAGSKGG